MVLTRDPSKLRARPSFCVRWSIARAVDDRIIVLLGCLYDRLRPFVPWYRNLTGFAAVAIGLWIAGSAIRDLPVLSKPVSQGTLSTVLDEVGSDQSLVRIEGEAEWYCSLVAQHRSCANCGITTYVPMVELDGSKVNRVVVAVFSGVIDCLARSSVPLVGLIRRPSGQLRSRLGEWPMGAVFALETRNFRVIQVGYGRSDAIKGLLVALLVLAGGVMVLFWHPDYSTAWAPPIAIFGSESDSTRDSREQG